MLKLETVFKLRVIYKSGATQDFEATEFSISQRTAKWTAVGNVHPVALGLDEIAAVWRLGTRKRIARPQ